MSSYVRHEGQLVASLHASLEGVKTGLNIALMGKNCRLRFHSRGDGGSIGGR